MAANRGEIAIRIMRAGTELGLRTATIYSNEDRFSLHRFKADEAYEVGSDKGPVAAYLDIDGIIALAKDREVDAIHPGYGFLSENSRFSRACAEAGITFVGPPPELLEALGDKTAARRLARQAGVPTVPGTDLVPEDPRQILLSAESVGYPLIVKASFGGGRGIRVVNSPDELLGRLEEARGRLCAPSETAPSSWSVTSPERAISRYRSRPIRTVQWYISGSAIARYSGVTRRWSSWRRRPTSQTTCGTRFVRRRSGSLRPRVISMPAPWNSWSMPMRGSGFSSRQTPRIQVEHTVTEMVTGIDLVRSQILVAQGCRLHEAPLSIPPQSEIPRRGTAMPCRITTEDPANEFFPDYGRLQTYRSPRGDGSRLDGTAYAGAVLSPFYDSLLVKLTAWDTEPFRRLHPGRPGSAGVPDPGGRDQHPVPAQCDQPPGFPERSGDHPLPGREARTLRDTVAS